MSLNNIGTILRAGRDYLAANGIDLPALEADIFMMKALGDISKMDLFMYLEDFIHEDEEMFFWEMVMKRCDHIPSQYILGNCEFMGLEFEVNENVLIPRPDTEILVETVLDKAKIDGIGNIIDIGTGSGAIAISLVKNGIKNAAAVDISEKALEVAERNAVKNGVKENINFFKADALSDDFSVKGYDAVISNPPYIRSDVIPTLMPEVKDNEPMGALDGGEDGLIFYRKITEKAADELNEGCWLFYEIGYDQGEEVRNILTSKDFKDVEVIKDLSGNDRVVCGRK